MLTLLRHGRTAANKAGQLQGRSDHPLDELGQRQAAAAASAIGSADRVIASSLPRAQQTAAALGQTVETDDRWIEIDYGEWEGRVAGELPPETWSTWRDDLDLRPPGGETLRELGARVRDALDELIVDADRQDIVVVSHMSPIKASIAWALGTGDEMTWRTHLGQAAICRIANRAGGPILMSYNDLGHLRDVVDPEASQ